MQASDCSPIYDLTAWSGMVEPYATDGTGSWVTGHWVSNLCLGQVGSQVKALRA